MPKSAIADWSTTAASNTDVGGVSIAENCSPANINDAIREVMAQVATWVDATTVDGDLTVSGGDINLNGATNVNVVCTATNGNAVAYLKKSASTKANAIYGYTGAAARWVIALGDTAAESGSNAGSNFAIACYDDAGSSLYSPLSIVRSTGNATFSGTVTCTSLTETSDARLKTDLERIGGALDKVSALTGYTFTRLSTGARETGLIAQDVQAVLPEAVTDNDGTLSLAYGNLAGLLVEAIKELRAEVAELRSRLEGEP